MDRRSRTQSTTFRASGTTQNAEVDLSSVPCPMEAFAQIELRQLPEHGRPTLMRGLVNRVGAKAEIDARPLIQRSLGADYP